MRFELLVVGLIATLIVACDRKEIESPAAPPRGRPVYGTGTIKGSVKFIGTLPPRKTITNEPCHPGATKTLLDEHVVVNDNGMLANVFVYLENAAPSDGSDREPALLDQVDCRYVPHAVGLQVGQTLRIRSSDPTMHNVHYDSDHNGAANFGQTVAGAEKPVTLNGKHEFIRVRCDVHPWMNATIGVFESPFFAVTAEPDGAFAITRVPAGRYKLAAWHELYGKIERDVEVKENEAAEVTFEYKPPQ